MHKLEKPASDRSMNPRTSRLIRKYAGPIVAITTGILPGLALGNSHSAHAARQEIVTSGTTTPETITTGAPHTIEVETTHEGTIETPGFRVEQREILNNAELQDHVTLQYQRGYEVNGDDSDVALQQMTDFVEAHSDIFDNIDSINTIDFTGIASPEDSEHGEPALGGLDTPSVKNEHLAAERLLLGTDGFLKALTAKYGEAYAQKVMEKMTTSSRELVLTPGEMSDIQSLADSLGMTPNQMIDTHDRVVPNPLPIDAQRLLNTIITNRRGVDIHITYQVPGSEQIVVPTVIRTPTTTTTTQTVTVPGETVITPGSVQLEATILDGKQGSDTHDAVLLPKFEGVEGETPQLITEEYGSDSGSEGSKDDDSNSSSSHTTGSNGTGGGAAGGGYIPLAGGGSGTGGGYISGGGRGRGGVGDGQVPRSTVTVKPLVDRQINFNLNSLEELDGKAQTTHPQWARSHKQPLHGNNDKRSMHRMNRKGRQR